MIARSTRNSKTHDSFSECAMTGRAVRPETECRARACEFLIALAGCPPEDLRWDETHQLQGHGHLNGHELVIIAPRDDEHHTIVLTAEDWNAVRRASTDQRRCLLADYAIADRARLVAVLATT